MRAFRNRRILGLMAGFLILALAMLVAVAWFFEDSWAGDLLQGAGILREREPTVFPSDDIQISSSVPQGAGQRGGLEGTAVSFKGGYDGWCKAWGIDPDHPSGVKYWAGTYRMGLEGQDWQGYSIDLHHSIRLGDTYQANAYASTEPGLCSVHWILANYSRGNPAAGLDAREEGVAIQTALWHYVEGFQPVWDPDCWCGKQAVFARATEIIRAARGQCVRLPSNMDLTASASALPPGQTANLTASVSDQFGQPYRGLQFEFSTTYGTLGMLTGVSGVNGQVPNDVTAREAGLGRVVARISGTFHAAAVDPLSEPKPRLIIVKSIPYSDEDSVEIAWAAMPSSVELKYFVAEQGADQTSTQGGQAITREAGVLLRWETVSEMNNQGFNIYTGQAETGPWTKLNRDLIPSQVPTGSSGGGIYEFVRQLVPPGVPYFYLLEAVGSDGTTTQYGPVTP